MRKFAAAACAIGLLTTLSTACSSAETDGEKLSWKKCPEGVAAAGVECTTLDVPLDYEKPDGKTIGIAVSRLASKNPDKRRGVLLTNSGGPGGETLTMPATLRKLGLPKSVLDSYDIIGMDPRGVGRSTPVTCGLKLTDHPSNIPTYARNAVDVAAEAKRVEAVAKKCAASRTAALLPHITTANTARDLDRVREADLDRVREALGESKVSYFGISYGTYVARPPGITGQPLASTDSRARRSGRRPSTASTTTASCRNWPAYGKRSTPASRSPS
ncbi:hypothetical protein ACIBRY_26065 [Streptomyces anulatus]